MNPFQQDIKNLVPNKIIEQMKDFKSSLGDDYEVAIRFESYGTMMIDKVNILDSDLICFCGNINGEKAQIIQHRSKINLMLIPILKSELDSLKS